MMYWAALLAVVVAWMGAEWSQQAAFPEAVVEAPAQQRNSVKRGSADLAGKSTLQPDCCFPDYPHPVFLFDGVCALCNGAVQFVLNRDAGKRVHFAAIQSEVAHQILDSRGRPELGPPLRDRNAPEVKAWKPSTMVLVENGNVYTHSTAALRMASYLDEPWRSLRFFLAVPRPLRDLGYMMVSLSRMYFGELDEGSADGTCMLGDPETNARFVDRSEPQVEEGCLA